MPYCPKCDMEFVEGITVCSDCGAPLSESVEAAKAAREAAEKRALEQFIHSMASGESKADEAGGLGETEGPEAGGEAELEKETLEALRSIAQKKVLETLETAPRRAVPASSVFVKKKEHYEDMQSSAAAFLLMGCVSAGLAIVFFARIVPAAENVRLMFSGILGAASLVFLSICFKTWREMAPVKEAAAQEEQQTKELVEWFLAAHPAETIDRQLAEEAALAGGEADTPEEQSLKRFGLIQDLLVTERDLPDPSYVDLLAEEIYDRSFGQE